MLSSTDTPLEDVLPFFTQLNIDVTFLVPTKIGYAKSIMDATSIVRSFLKRNEIHDYSAQLQGPNHKVISPAFFVTKDKNEPCRASLYRPITKKGDPRIWFTGLCKYCSPNNLLAIVCYEKILYVFNLSDLEVRESIGMQLYEKNDVERLWDEGHSYSAGFRIINNIRDASGAIARELLDKLKEISHLGYLSSSIAGDTGVGMTLEKYLGISPNSSKEPDYKGIEIKSARQKIIHPNRVNLFAKTPDWKNSKYSANRLLSEFGYLKDGRRQLYCTVTANKPNPQGLFFSVDDSKDILVGCANINGQTIPIVQWNMKSLRESLESKHHETFWVKADVRKEHGSEYFHYIKVIHTRKPQAHLLSTLIDSGIVTMDYTLSEKPKGVRDHGYLFKIKPENVPLLFPEPINYVL